MSADTNAHHNSRQPVAPGTKVTGAGHPAFSTGRTPGEPFNSILDFFEGLPLPAFIYQPETLQIVKANHWCTQHYGYSEVEFLSKTVLDMHPPDEHAAVVAQIALSRQGGNMTIRNWHHLHGNGNLLYVEVWASNIVLDGHAFRMAIINDVTEKKKTEAQLRASNERFELASKASKDAIYEWDLDTMQLFWTSGLTKQFGWQPNEVTFDFWREQVHEADVKGTVTSLDNALKNAEQEIWKHDYRWKHKSGHWCWVQERCYFLRNESGKAYRGIGVVQDISEQKRLEQELLKKELERQKIIGQASIDSQEQERTEIGKELHDNVNQILTTTKLYLDMAQCNADLKDEMVAKAAKNVQHVINEIRHLSRSLMDPSIGDLGLTDSVKNMVADFQMGRSLQIHLEIDGAPDDVLDRSKKLLVFRIIQEALKNIIRHANATAATILMRHEGREFTLSITDNGTGFNPNQTVRGAGLNNIKNRVYLVDGTFRVDAAPNKGTQLLIRFFI